MNEIEEELYGLRLHLSASASVTERSLKKLESLIKNLNSQQDHIVKIIPFPTQGKQENTAKRLSN